MATPGTPEGGMSATLQSHRVPCPAGYGTRLLHAQFDLTTKRRRGKMTRLALWMLILATPAWGQWTTGFCSGPSCGTNTFIGSDSLRDDDPDLTRAMNICVAHDHPLFIAVPEFRGWSDDYSGCHAVMEKWRQSGAAKFVARRNAKAAADREWLEQYVKGLK